METVNEIIFGTRQFPATMKDVLNGQQFRTDRPKALQDTLKEAVFLSVSEDDYAKETVARVMTQYKIPTFGEGAAKELLGCLGIWLTQLSPVGADRIDQERKARKLAGETFKPREVVKPEV